MFYVVTSFYIEFIVVYIKKPAPNFLNIWADQYAIQRALTVSQTEWLLFGTDNCCAFQVWVISTERPICGAATSLDNNVDNRC